MDGQGKGKEESRKELQRQAAGTRNLQFVLLLGAKAQRQSLGYFQRGDITEISTSLEGKGGGAQSIFFTLPTFLYRVESTSVHLLIHLESINSGSGRLGL